MCAVSNMGDYWRTNDWPKWEPYQPLAPIPNTIPVGPYAYPAPEVTKADLDALKREMEELKKLLVAAKKYDEATGQPDCEAEDKVALIKKVAKLVGVDMSEVFGG